MRIAFAAVETAGLFLLWFLYVGRGKAEDYIAGAVSAVCAAVAFGVARRVQRFCFAPPLRALLECRRLPLMIARGTVTVAWELIRRAGGAPRRSLFRLASYSAVGRGCRNAGKRALTVLFATLPPNSLVVGIDVHGRLILFHQLRKEPVPRIIRAIESA